MVKSKQIVKHKEIAVKDNNSKQTKVSKDSQSAIPRGRPKSGRIWKSERKKFSTAIKTKGIKSSFEKKQQLRQKMKQIKEMSNAIKAEKQEEKEKTKERRRANLKRQEENRLKSEVVQVITNTKKLKRTKKKHLRNIVKRDTTVVSK